MTSWKWQLAVRGVVFAFLVLLIFVLSGYGPEPLLRVEVLGDDLGHLERFYSSEASIGRALSALGQPPASWHASCSSERSYDLA